jgi:hypothetical protein
MGAIVGVVVAAIGCVILYLVFEQFLQHLFEPLRWWLTRVASREPRTADQVSCSLRAIEGNPYGFARTWVSGDATFEPGVIRFASGGAETAIAVASIGAMPADTSRGVIRSARVRLYTAEGILELSMQRAGVDRMRTIVAVLRPL